MSLAWPYLHQEKQGRLHLDSVCLSPNLRSIPEPAATERSKRDVLARQTMRDQAVSRVRWKRVLRLDLDLAPLPVANHTLLSIHHYNYLVQT